MDEEHIPLRPDFESDTDLLSFGQAAKEFYKDAEPEQEGFDPAISQAVFGLLFVGRLQKTFHVLGHTFTLRTLTAGEELIVAELIKDYDDVVAKGKAYCLAVVSASLLYVDNKELVGQLGPDRKSHIEMVYEKIKTDWYGPTVETVYACYNELQIEQAKAYEELESKSQASRASQPPSADSR